MNAEQEIKKIESVVYRARRQLMGFRIDMATKHGRKDKRIPVIDALVDDLVYIELRLDKLAKS